MLVMEPNLKEDLNRMKANLEVPEKETNAGENSKKCNQCGFVFSLKCNLRRHSKMHSEEKSDNCNQCGYESSDKGLLKASKG